MHIVKLKKHQLFFLFFISFIVLCSSTIYVTLKIRNAYVTYVYSKYASTSYTYDNELQNHEEYIKHVLNEYKDKKVLALTFDDGPRKIH